MTLKERITRKAVIWWLSHTPFTWNIEGGTTITHIALLDKYGNFVGNPQEIFPEEVFSVAGSYTVNLDDI